MTRYIVTVDNKEDLEKLIVFLEKNGVRYELNEDDGQKHFLKEDEVVYQKTELVEDEEEYGDFVFTEEMKRELDEDEDAYQRGELKPITSEESKRRIDELLNNLRAKNAI